MATATPITTALFWSKVRVPENGAGCWEWTSTLNANGYGRFCTQREKIAAHRFAYELVKGQIPEGLHIRHLCHNRLCVNPAHLLVGTPKDNAQDALDAGRFSRGNVNGNSKLDDETVRYIRQNPDNLKGRALAAKFGISPATVSGVQNGRVWRHVGEQA
jgi:hypothetical protein